MNNDKKMIEIKALRERIFLKKLLDTQPNLSHIIYTPYDGQDKYDATWIQLHPTLNMASEVICEIKVRNYDMKSYNSWVIQKDKYDYLMSQPADKRLYICVHPDGYQVWDLNKCSEPQWKTTNLPKDNQHIDNEISKINGDLMSEDAEKWECTNNIYLVLDEAANIWNKRNITTN